MYTLAWRLAWVGWISYGAKSFLICLDFLSLLSGFAPCTLELHVDVFSVRATVDLIFVYHETSLNAVLA